MRNFKVLLATLVAFSLLLSACASDPNEGASNDNVVIGNDNVLEPVVTDDGLGNLNGNANANDNANTNEVEETAMVTEPSGMMETTTPEAMATPLGTAMGTAPVDPSMTETQPAGETTPMGTAMATEPSGETTPMGTPVGTEMATEPAGVGTTEGFVGGMRLSELIGLNVNNPAGEGVGEVDSVVIDQSTCRVQYVLVRADDDRLVPVPLPVLYEQGQAGTLGSPLTLNIADDLWLNAPSWTSDMIPDLTADGWDTDLSPYWSAYGTNGAAANDNSNSNDNTQGDMAAGGAVRLYDVTDLNVTNAAGEDLGDIEDILLSLDNSNAAYAILAVGGVLDMGETLIPVPCDRITWQWEDGDDQPNPVLDIDPTLLENAPALDDYPTSYDSGWDAEWRTYWDGV